ncbi:MAG TPA: hypothetical protein VK149_04170 [Sideroxyarcus sp.]|nr:hypothetical protein [Sideroxyarcus sp.]
MGDGKTLEWWEDWTATMKAKHGNSNGHGPSLAIEALRTLPTPDAYAGSRGGARNPEERRSGGHTVSLQDQVERGTNWGQFEPAIRRWEAVTRPAPEPTRADGKDGAARLSPLFTEWMMGLPEGWITGQGLNRKDELKMCGNGVVPQQAILALERMNVTALLEES